MSHLSPAEFVDLAEGTLDARRAAHAGTCDACRAQAAVVRDALQMTGAADDVPEPSPLFWDQLSARVRETVAREPRSSWQFGWRGVQPDAAMLAIAAAIIAVLVVIPGVRRAGTPQSATPSGAPPAAAADADPRP